MRSPSNIHPRSRVFCWAIDADDEAITRALLHAQSDAITNRWMGRRYHNLLLNAEFVDMAIEIKTGIYTDHAQGSFVLESMADAAVAMGVVNFLIKRVIRDFGESAYARRNRLT